MMNLLGPIRHGCDVLSWLVSQTYEKNNYVLTKSGNTVKIYLTKI